MDFADGFGIDLTRDECEARYWPRDFLAAMQNNAVPKVDAIKLRDWKRSILHIRERLGIRSAGIALRQLEQTGSCVKPCCPLMDFWAALWVDWRT